MASRKKLFRLPWRTSRQIGADVDEELRFHLDARAQDLMKLGLSDAAARAQAVREFGDVSDARRYITTLDRSTEAAMRRSEVMSDFWNDLTYAARKLRKSPAFMITTVVTLALGVGANTAIFSVVNSVLLRPLPYPEADRLVRIKFTDGGFGDAGSPPDLADYRTRSKTFEDFAMLESAAMNLVTPGSAPERLTGMRVTSSWFSLLRTHPLIGRTFARGEDQEGAPRLAVLSENLWRAQFGADPKVLGRSIQLNGEAYTVVGVVAAESQYPLTAQVFTPLVFTAQDRSDGTRGARWLGMLARVKSGTSLAAATADMSRITTALNAQFPNVYNKRTAVPVPIRDWIVGDIRKPLWVVMGAVMLVLLIACANVANLLLVRATSREAELAVRTALGAGEGRLVRQLITEALLLTAIGSLAGIGIARVGIASLITMASASLPMLARTRMDAITLGTTAVIALITGIIFGVLPAHQVTKGSLADSLRAGARGTRTRPGTLRLRRTIVIAEMATAVTLLAGAGLLLRSFSRLMHVDPGFNPANVMTYNISLPPQRYATDDAQRAFGAALETRLKATPGVTRVGIATELPLDGHNFTLSFKIRGKPDVPPNQQPAARIVSVTPDYFSAIGMRVTSGRSFTAGDRNGEPQVAMVSQAFVAKNLPNENPIGKYVELGWRTDGVKPGGTIVGVVADVKENKLDADVQPMVYIPYDQWPRSNLSIAVRTATSQAPVAPALRAELREIDKDMPVYNLRPMSEIVATSVATERFYMVLLTAFAGVALLLAAVGLYGVIAYAVSQRTTELGVRVALGATGNRISRMIIGEGLAMSMIGVVVGLVISAGLTRVLASLLFGVQPNDPVTFIAVAIALVVVAITASYLPARRAARADPLIAMRGD
jgi:putative ABC transport system permease protein